MPSSEAEKRLYMIRIGFRSLESDKSESMKSWKLSGPLNVGEFASKYVVGFVPSSEVRKIFLDD